jgi:hypothetical protein
MAVAYYHDPNLKVLLPPARQMGDALDNDGALI